MKTIQHKFVKVIPEIIEEGILYISLDYRTAIHRCPCGCQEEIITPFSANDWTLQFYGEVVSLSPSIGNFQLPCRSHYFIVKNNINWVKERPKKNTKFFKRYFGKT
jgi:Family of unknown function (DUF6527)